MKYFSIERIKQAIEHLQKYDSNWVLVPLVFAVNNVTTGGFTNTREQGKPGTDTFFAKYFSGALVGIPDSRPGYNVLRPRFSDYYSRSMVAKDKGKDYIYHQDNTKLWANAYSSRGYREMETSGLIEIDESKFKLKAGFQKRWHEELPDTFHFEELLVWLYAFRGFDDSIKSWEALFADFQEKMLGKGKRFDAVYSGRFKVKNAVPWPSDFLSQRPSDEDFIRELMPSGLKPKSKQNQKPGANIIFYGPPGTGKSHSADAQAAADPMRVLFHPEYTYNDFVGLYRPVVGSHHSEKIAGYDGSDRAKPICYFDFVPGPLLLAVAAAFNNPTQDTFLIIDEINRGDCAAIFGDIFQLLDRMPDGRSKYGITLRQEVAAWLDANAKGWRSPGQQKLHFPDNFTILATMNTSDQSLLPMDSAFKRRWQWKSCKVDFDSLVPLLGKRPVLKDGFQQFDWIKLANNLNERITKSHLEDRQIGQWFISPDSATGEIDRDAFGNKCLFYLWHDVFKDEQNSDESPFEVNGSATFQQIQDKFFANGLKAIFKDEVVKAALLQAEQQPAAL